MQQKFTMEQCTRLKLCIDERAFFPALKFIQLKLKNQNVAIESALHLLFWSQWKLYSGDVEKWLSIKNVATTLCKTNEANFTFSDTYCKNKSTDLFGTSKMIGNLFLIDTKKNKQGNAFYYISRKANLYQFFFIKVGRTLMWVLSLAKGMSSHTLCTVQ